MYLIENENKKTEQNHRDKRRSPNVVQTGKTVGNYAKKRKGRIPEHDNLAQNLVVGEDSGPMLTTSEMIDISEGADSTTGES
ncbi:MAG: hypothetical protein AB7C97_06415 [Oscillospiraceae bacterium]